MASVRALVVAAVVLIPALGRAADPQPYTVEIAETGHSDVDAAIAASSLLASLRESAPAPPFALIERARGDADRIQIALQSFGYYGATVNVTIDGHAVSDPDLPNVLDRVAQGTAVAVKVAVEPGPQYTLRDIHIDGSLPNDDAGALALAAGDPAIAADVLAGQTRLLTALQEDGYAYAKVDPPIAYLDHDARAVDLDFKVEAGPRAVVGPIAIRGRARRERGFHPRRHHRASGRPIQTERHRKSAPGAGEPRRVLGRQRARRRTAGCRFRSAADLRRAGTADARGEFVGELFHRPRRRRLGRLDPPQSVRQCRTTEPAAAVSGLGGNATDGLGYSASAAFIKPRFLEPNQAFEADMAAVNQDLDAYHQRAETVGIFLRRKYLPQWTVSVGLTAMHDEVSQEGTDRLYQLFGVPVSLAYDSTGLADPLADPTHGYRAALSVTPTFATGASDLIFATVQASGSAYLDLSGDGRSVIALRALAATVQGGSTFDLPPDQRLYAGGSATVRGFRYQSIGPRFPDDKPAGAASIDAGTVELRQRFGEDWGAAAFVDAGQASDRSLPFNGDINAGGGVGVRYYTGIGAIRADVAVPLTNVPDGDAFEIYVGLGQAF